MVGSDHLVLGALGCSHYAAAGPSRLPGSIPTSNVGDQRHRRCGPSDPDSIAASVITVIGIVFSITIVTLTLASTQFGPRMLRNFIRDRGTQLTLGTFVATFVYCIVVLVSIGPGDRGEFVPHISITTAFGLC